MAARRRSPLRVAPVALSLCLGALAAAPAAGLGQGAVGEDPAAGAVAAVPLPILPSAPAPAASLHNPWVNRALLLGTLLALDLEARDAVQDWRGDTGDGFWDATGTLGEWKLVAPIVAGASLAIGWAGGGEAGLARGVATIAGVAAGSVANETLNQVVGRGRPSWGDGAFDFRPFRGHSSFPSGHTGFAFSVAGAIDGATGSAGAAAVAYGLAGLVGFSRMNDDKHWLSDVVVASLLSSAVARRVARSVAGALADPVTNGAETGEGAKAGPELVVTSTGVAVRIPH